MKNVHGKRVKIGTQEFDIEVDDNFNFPYGFLLISKNGERYKLQKSLDKSVIMKSDKILLETASIYCPPSMLHAYHMVPIKNLVLGEDGNMYCPEHKNEGPELLRFAKRE